MWRGKLIRKHPPDARGVISVSEDQLINATFQLQPGFRDGRGRESGNNASGELMSTVHSQPQNPLLQPQKPTDSCHRSSQRLGGVVVGVAHRGTSLIRKYPPPYD